jgi:hypothetical protein
MQQNKARISVKFNWGATKPKVNVLKTMARCNICNNIMKDLKGNNSNIQKSKSG